MFSSLPKTKLFFFYHLGGVHTTTKNYREEKVKVEKNHLVFYFYVLNL